jgi:hypothetical protein
MGPLDFLKALFRAPTPPPGPRRLDGRSKALLAASLRRLGAVLRKTIFDIYAAMPSSWNTPRMAARSAS